MTINELYDSYRNDQTQLAALLKEMRRHAMRYLKDEDDCQEFLIEIVGLLPTLEIRKSFVAWLTIRLRWKANELRRNRSIHAVEQIPTIADGECFMSDEDVTDALIFADLENSGDLDVDYDELDRLENPPLDEIDDLVVRQAAELMLDGLTQAEIAKRLGIQPAALRKRLQRYRDRQSLARAA